MPSPFGRQQNPQTRARSIGSDIQQVECAPWRRQLQGLGDDRKHQCKPEHEPGSSCEEADVEAHGSTPRGEQQYVRQQVNVGDSHGWHGAAGNQRRDQHDQSGDRRPGESQGAPAARRVFRLPHTGNLVRHLESMKAAIGVRQALGNRSEAADEGTT